MGLIADVGRGDWLLERAGGWATAGGVAGTGFAAYARILHPLPAHRWDASVTDQWGVPLLVDGRPWRWSDIAERNGKRVHPLVQWVHLSGRTPPVAVETDDGWTVGPPEEGQLDTDLLAALTVHLARSTTTPTDLVAAVWEGWGDLGAGSSAASFGFGEPTAADIAAQQQRALVELRHRRRMIADALEGPRFAWPGRGFHLMTASLDTFARPDWLDTVSIEDHPAPGHTPQMLWPEDHAWVLATEIDWDATIVAGSRTLVADILGDPRFEAFEVDPDDDLSWAADTVNQG